MIEGRIFIPRDVFVTLCVEVQKLSDSMLKAAQDMAREIAHVPEESQVLNHLMASNTRLGTIEAILKIIIDEGSATGGQTCHA